MSQKLAFVLFLKELNWTVKLEHKQMPRALGNLKNIHGGKEKTIVREREEGRKQNTAPFSSVKTWDIITNFQDQGINEVVWGTAVSLH